MKIKPMLPATFVSLLALSAASAASGTLQTLVRQPPVIVGLPFLLTDGSVLFQGSSFSDWWKLTPDVTGNYVNGTWTQAASIPYTWNYAPFAFASAVLADGRVVIEGGEYNENGPFSLTNKGAIYDPLRNDWSQLQPPPGWDHIGDSASIIMPNGKFLLGDKLTTRIAELDPATLTWTELGSDGKLDFNAEEGWTLLPDGTFLTVDVQNAPHAERYTYSDTPGGGRWNSAGSTPTSLAWDFGDNLVPFAGGTYLPPGETGPCLLRPNATVFCVGASNDAAVNIAHTAIYSLATAAWTAGPNFPPGDDAGDDSAVLLPSGNVLVSASSGVLYEYDGTRLTSQAQVSPAALLMILPSGEALVSGETLPPSRKPDPSFVPTANVQVYTPAAGAGPSAAWAPSISASPSTVDPGATYTISGTQFNGLSQGQAFGDELVAATNYPLLRITNNATGHVFYARTHDHSSMGVATGNAVVSTKFDVPAHIEDGASTLAVVANGIASPPVNVQVSKSTVPFAIGAGISGSWYNASQSGHGFQIEVLPTNPPTLSAFWFVFAPAGGQAWIGGTGTVAGDRAEIQAFQVAGAGALFPPNFNAANTHPQPWGTIVFTFNDCNTGQVSWNSPDAGYGVGSLPIARLATPAGIACP